MFVKTEIKNSSLFGLSLQLIRARARARDTPRNTMTGFWKRKISSTWDIMDIAWVGSVPNIFFNIFCIYSYLLGPSFTLLFIFGRVGFLTIHLLALLNIVWLLGGLLLFLDLLQTSERGRAFVRHHHGHGGGGAVE